MLTSTSDVGKLKCYVEFKMAHLEKGLFRVDFNKGDKVC